MTVDLRTRRDGVVGGLDEGDVGLFLDHDLPLLFEKRRSTLVSAAHLELRPLVLRVGDRTWVLRREDGAAHDSGRYSVDDTMPAEGEKYIELGATARQVADLVNDQVTPIGMMTAGTLDLVHGQIGRLLDWWLVLRSALDDHPVHTAGAVTLPDDLHRSFTLDDDPDEILGFLESAGFLHLRGVFTTDEMAAISADMDRAEPTFTPGDGNSWWATLDDGTERVVRMQRFEQHSATLASLLEDPRFLRISEIARSGHTTDWATDNRSEALFKPIGVASGISDVPWHKDCSLGRHSYECCSLTVGISVTGGGPTSGQLRVIAGSHRALVWPSLLDTTKLDLPDIALPTETGDVTVHLSCTLHMAQAPTDTERRVVYTGFRLPSTDDDTAAARIANRQLLKASREGAPRNTTQAAAR